MKIEAKKRKIFCKPPIFYRFFSYILYFLIMIENQTIKDRLKIFIKHLGIGQAKFEKKCNLSNGYVNNSKCNYGASKSDYILKVFPELNRDRLLYFEGEMLKSLVNIENGDNSTQFIDDGNHTSTSSTKNHDFKKVKL